MIKTIDEIKDNSIWEISGKLNSKSFNNVLNWIDKNIISYYDQRLIHYVSVEILQQFSRLSQFKDFRDDFLFVISFVEEDYFIGFSKIIDNKRLLNIEQDLAKINSLDNQQLKMLYKERLSNFSHGPTNLYLIDLKRKTDNDISMVIDKYNEDFSSIELIVKIEEKFILRHQLDKLFGINKANIIFDWHKKKQFQYEKNIKSILDTFIYHRELLIDLKFDLLTNEEFLKTYLIRDKGIETIPNEWVNVNTLEIDNEKLTELWLRPSEGYLYKMLSKSKESSDTDRLDKLMKSKGFLYRGIDAKNEDRIQNRFERLQKSIEDRKVVIYLGRQNRVYKELQKKLNKKYKGKKQFISDHVWSSCGYIEPGVKSSNSWLSVIQAMETVRRLPELGLTSDAVSKREIAFCLDGYDYKHVLAAMYSNPNKIERNFGKPEIEGIDKFEFAYTGLTDLELANIVRNRNWFELLTFYRTGKDGEPEELTKEQVAKEYGIKYIGDLMIERIKRNR